MRESRLFYAMSAPAAGLVEDLAVGRLAVESERSTSLGPPSTQ